MDIEKSNHAIQSLLQEQRLFKPSASFSEQAHIKHVSDYQKLYEDSINHPDIFWERMAREKLHWFKPWHTVLNWQADQAKAEWFQGGELNVSYNCLDRHLTPQRQHKTALLWEGEPGEVRRFTYLELQAEVMRAANMLKALGMTTGDRVALYMPPLPELVIIMLACTRIGAVHTVIFGGFSSQALQDRINDSGCVVLVTADGGYRKGSAIAMKAIADEACAHTPTIRHMLVVQRTQQAVVMQEQRDIWWHELAAQVVAECVAESLPAEHPLFILYTSGTTGKPKGVLHTTGGYLLGTTVTSEYVFDLRDDDIYWCTADPGWITGHSYVVYGPLSNGATIFIYEGSPVYPAADRYWDMIARHKISIFYTAPTAIRMFVRLGNQWPEQHDLSSLRLLGSVGEPINPEAWMWFYAVIGKQRCPIVDTWWQTETGMIMIAPMPGATPLKPGSASFPQLGVEIDIFHKDGSIAAINEGGFLGIKKPWPAMARTIYGDHERYKNTYWTQIPGIYFTSDGAHIDSDGYTWIMGRVDDVINVSGHRLGTMEIESAVVTHPGVAECAVVARPDELKGQAIVAFVTLKQAWQVTAELKAEIQACVVEQIGALARPEEIRFTDALPKTRSGKIMRRLLREIASTGSVNGDITTLEDLSVLEKLQQNNED